MNLIHYAQQNQYPGSTEQVWTGNKSTLPMALGQLLQGATMSASGSKLVVICNTSIVECDDMDKAQAKAEALAHQYNQDAYILKPVRKVAPKREVVTTDLP